MDIGEELFLLSRESIPRIVRFVEFFLQRLDLFIQFGGRVIEFVFQVFDLLLVGIFVRRGFVPGGFESHRRFVEFGLHFVQSLFQIGFFVLDLIVFLHVLNGNVVDLIFVRLYGRIELFLQFSNLGLVILLLGREQLHPPLGLSLFVIGRPQLHAKTIPLIRDLVQLGSRLFLRPIHLLHQIFHDGLVLLSRPFRLLLGIFHHFFGRFNFVFQSPNAIFRRSFLRREFFVGFFHLFVFGDDPFDFVGVFFLEGFDVVPHPVDPSFVHIPYGLFFFLASLDFFLLLSEVLLQVPDGVYGFVVFVEGLARLLPFVVEFVLESFDLFEVFFRLNLEFFSGGVHPLLEVVSNVLHVFLHGVYRLLQFRIFSV
mmetsp:Transcript_30809/g.61449  ORF Transcript_30809/g.61449 Transcript_30809/m.61449 type:complete len:368 (-) Transcript_30809:588-1691(-)